MINQMQSNSLTNSCIFRRIILFLAILISGGNMIIPRLPTILVIFLLYFIYVRGRFSIHKQLISLVICLCLVAIMATVNPFGIDIASFSIRFANFLVAFIVLDLYLKSSFSLFKSDLYALMKYFPYQAILTVFLGTFCSFLFIEVHSDAGSFYTFFGVLNYHVISGVTSVRPNGFFFEPGVFHIYLNTYLLLSLFVFKNKKHTLVATLSVIFTQSTTGLIVLFMIFGVYLFQNYITKGNLLNRTLKFFVSIVLLSMLLLMGWSNVEDKIFGESRGSLIARQYDTLTGLNVVVANPIYGIGFDYDNYYIAAKKLGYQDTEMTAEGIKKRNNSNGIVMMFYNIGIPLSCVFIFGLFRQQLIDNKLLFGGIIFVSLLTEAIIFTPFFLIIIFSGLIPNVNKIKKERTNILKVNKV